jgi:hypothetical protein
MSTILIHRDLQVIDGFVQVPPNKETDKNRVTVVEALSAIAGSEQVYLSQGSGNNRGWKAGAQSTFRLPGLVPGTSYSSDPVDVLSSY